MAKKTAKSAKKPVAKPAAKGKSSAGKGTAKGKSPVKMAAKAKPVAKPAQKAVSKAIPSAKKSSHPGLKTTTRKSVAVTRPERKLKGKAPVIVKKSAPAEKSAAKPDMNVKKDVQKAKPAVTPAPKKEAAPAKKEVKGVPVAMPARKESEAKQAVTPPTPPANLPKLPKGIVLKKQKGKLAPGEKRIVKTDIITHHVIADLDLKETKEKPEPKGKFQLEYIIHTPITLLYDFLTTPNGLAEWFADGVDMKNDIYTFDWDGQKQNAKVVSAKIDSYIRLRWMDKPEGYYFEFRLTQDELTNEVSLIVTDFGENQEDMVTSRRLWDSQIQRLVKALGTY